MIFLFREKNQTFCVRVESCSHFINKQTGCSDYSIECVDFICGRFGQTYSHPQLYGRNQYDSEMFYCNPRIPPVTEVTINYSGTN